MTADECDRKSKFANYSATQKALTNRLKEIADEASKLPQIPRYFDSWIEGYGNDSGFNLKTFDQHWKIKREYAKLMEDADNNLRQMKILAIEDLIEKINNTLNKSE
jgi:hypothetical protein